MSTDGTNPPTHTPLSHDLVAGSKKGQVQAQMWESLTGVVRMRLQAVDHVIVGLQQHQVLPRVSVPDEDVAAVGATQHKVVAPETRLLDLTKHKNRWNKTQGDIKRFFPQFMIEIHGNVN